MKKTTFGWVFSLLFCVHATNAQTANNQKEVLIPTVSWGQETPYNSQLPTVNGNHVQAGCVPVAYAIIMNHWQWPLSGVGETDPYMTWTDGIDVPSRDLTPAYEWPLEDPSRLIADIGSALKTDYSIYESGTFTADDALVNRFSYHPDMKKHHRKDYSDSTWHQMLRSELDSNRPVFYTAGREGGGHAFVVDGYDHQGHYHINWGWNGNHNGWYPLDSLVVGNRNYDKSHSMLTGFVPHRELYEDVSKDNRDRHMQDITLSYNIKSGLLAITHPRYSVITLKSEGIDMYHLLSRWSEYTSIDTSEYPEGRYEITIHTGPYSKTILFQNVKSQKP